MIGIVWSHIVLKLCRLIQSLPLRLVMHFIWTWLRWESLTSTNKSDEGKFFFPFSNFSFSSYSATLRVSQTWLPASATPIVRSLAVARLSTICANTCTSREPIGLGGRNCNFSKFCEPGKGPLASSLSPKPLSPNFQKKSEKKIEPLELAHLLHAALKSCYETKSLLTLSPVFQ